MPKVRGRATALALACVAAAGCRGVDAGIGAQGGPPATPDAGLDHADAPTAADAPFGLPDGWLSADTPDLIWEPVAGVQGRAAELGCADGSREGFLDPT